MFLDFKCFVVFCLLSWCGQVDSVKCKPSKMCNKQGGECLGPRKEVPEGADYLGRCKGKCKCYTISNPVSTRSTVCTVSGPDPGKRCQFPFKVGKKVYNNCKELEGGKSICATTTKKNGKLERKKWGYCGRCSEAVEMLPNFFYQCDMEKMTNSTKRGAAGDIFQKWSNNIVPYQFDTSFTNTDRQTFLIATQQIAAASCVSFVESPGSQYLYVTRQCACNGGCFSGGFTDGLGAASPRTLTIGSPCLNPNSQSSIGFVAHEILHALGIAHTQKRPDRNSFIKVNIENITPTGAVSQFDLCSGCNTFNTPYDCSSIMHYRAFSFSQGTAYSMTALNPSNCDLFSSNRVLTNSDNELINRIYNCATDTTPTITPTAATPTTTLPPPTSTCLGSCGGMSPGGCYCDSACAQYNDCCPDKKEQCSPTTTSTTTTPAPPTTTSQPSSLTCQNNCGMKVSSNGNSCYCDNFCIYYNDCCDDREQYC